MVTKFNNFPDLDQVHAVVLCNYLRKHHALVFQQVAKRVKKLTILLSTEMEPDRNWAADWGELDVRVQSNWMYTARWKHPNGFDEQNFIHIPVDTVKQLRQLKPDIVFSYEMGMRTALSGVFRMMRRSVPLVMVGNMADHIENERGFLRRSMRKFVRSRVDFATYNGPGCKRYLESLGFGDEQLFHFPYCIDPEKVFKGEKTFHKDGHRNLLYCGALSSRKGIVPFTQSLADAVVETGMTSATLSIAGGGELADEVLQLANDRLEIEMLGSCNPSQLSNAYCEADICVFPTLGDEWGLVPIEAMASGVPVLGSTLAQSIEAKLSDGLNGWSFDPLKKQSMDDAIRRSLATSHDDLVWMSQAARQAAADCSAQVSADKFCDVIEFIRTGQRSKNQTSVVQSRSSIDEKPALNPK